MKDPAPALDERLPAGCCSGEVTGLRQRASSTQRVEGGDQFSRRACLATTFSNTDSIPGPRRAAAKLQINLWESLAGQGHPPLEVISWIAGLLGAIAVSTAGATWVVKRWHETRTEPYGLRVLLDVAVGDPGHTVFVLNQRGAPVRVECWGVMRLFTVEGVGADFGVIGASVRG